MSLRKATSTYLASRMAIVSETSVGSTNIHTSTGDETQTVYTQLFLNAVPPRIGMLLRTGSGSFVTWEEAKEIFLKDQMGVRYAATRSVRYRSHIRPRSARRSGPVEGLL